MTRLSAQGEAALRYAARGWAVIPLHTPSGNSCSCNSADCKKQGKHPRTKDGLKSASVDEACVRAWWTKWPDANVGVATGEVSGIVVLDVDGDDGKRTLKEWTDVEGPLPETLSCKTGRGAHFLYKHPGGTVKNRVAIGGPGLDLRADGGYVVAPPSVHANGSLYRVMGDVPLAELPKWLLQQNSSESAEPKAREPFRLVPLQEGLRNHKLTSLGGTLRWCGLGHIEIAALLHFNNGQLCDPPLRDKEVEEIAASVSRYPTERTRSQIFWFPRKPHEIQMDHDIRFMRDYQKAWLWTLMDFSWSYGGVIRNEQHRLADLASATDHEQFAEESAAVLSKFIKLDAAGIEVLLHPEIASYYVKTALDTTKKSDAGKARHKKSQTDDFDSFGGGGSER
jgi:hypothetical protein